MTKVGGTLLQAEDELAAINMIIGASYGGTPSLTATSGPGLSLMIEALGLATSAEIPIVVVDVMRGGPSTGIPTKSEQGDLNIAIYGMHGDAPHLVLAPQSVGDCVFTTQWATYLAEALQAPAIVLSDQFMGQSRAAIERPADVAFIGARERRQRNFRHLQAPRHGGQRRVADGDPGNARRPVHRRRAHPFRTRHADQRRRRSSGPARQARATSSTDFNYGDHWASVEGGGDLAVITWGCEIEATAAACRDLGSQALAIGTDVTREDEVERLVRTALRALRPAGRRLQQCRFSGAARAAGAAGRGHLRRACSTPMCARCSYACAINCPRCSRMGKGRIVVNASVSGVRNPNPGFSLYSASKAAVDLAGRVRRRWRRPRAA